MSNEEKKEEKKEEKATGVQDSEAKKVELPPELRRARELERKERVESSVKLPVEPRVIGLFIALSGAALAFFGQVFWGVVVGTLGIVYMRFSE